MNMIHFEKNASSMFRSVRKMHLQFTSAALLAIFALGIACWPLLANEPADDGEKSSRRNKSTAPVPAKDNDQSTKTAIDKPKSDKPGTEKVATDKAAAEKNKSDKAKPDAVALPATRRRPRPNLRTPKTNPRLDVSNWMHRCHLRNPSRHRATQAQ